MTKFQALQLVVGLGNPGSKYHKNRHNIGQLFLEWWEKSRMLNWQQKYKGAWAQSDGIHFLAPQTFMNLSGESVVPLVQFFKLEYYNMIVLHDELDLPLGQIEFKMGGGLAGHNGLKSIAGLSGTQDFLRLRMGIGRPVYGDVSSWVLGNFTSDEMIILEKVFIFTGEALAQLMNGVALSSLQTKYNKKVIS